MLAIRNLAKTYASRAGGAAVAALKDVSLSVEAGEFFALLGPSGCGKTTLLQSIAGLEAPTAGRIDIAGVPVFDADTGQQTPANRRGIGMVFQSYAIWPHMTVYDNVAFPLVYGRDHGGGRDRDNLRSRVMEALARVKLADYAERPAPHLSGGQQQRVALARAIVNEPRLLLLDEPLSNLDAKLRHAMRDELRNLVKSLGLTAIFVTHDQTEALAMADRVALMRDGEIVQIGAPDDIYFRPRSMFAASFMGGGNLLKGKVAIADGRRMLDTAIGRIACDIPADLAPGAEAVAVLRPHAITFAAEGAEGANHFRGAMRQRTFLGDAIEAEILVNGEILRLRLNSYDDAPRAENVVVVIAPERCVVTAVDDQATS